MKNFINNSNEIVLTRGTFVRIVYWSALFPLSCKIQGKDSALKIEVRHLNKARIFYSVTFTKSLQN